MYTKEIPSIDLNEFVKRVLMFLTGVVLMVLLIAVLLKGIRVSWVLLLVVGAVLVGFTIKTLFDVIEKAKISNSHLRVYTTYLVVGFFFPAIGIVNFFKWLSRKKVPIFKSAEERKPED